jgi:large subunit ribosomal protein L22
MKTYARLRYLGVGPLKVRRYAGTIKGESVDRALAILSLQPGPACQALHKLVRSAMANAQNNHNLAPEFLYVSNVLVDQGPSMKRIRPRARGRAYRVLKRSSHVTIELDLKPGLSMEQIEAEQEEAAKPRRRRRKPGEEPAATGEAAGEAEAAAEKKAPRAKKAPRKTAKAPTAKAAKSTSRARAKAKAEPAESKADAKAKPAAKRKPKADPATKKEGAKSKAKDKGSKE